MVGSCDVRFAIRLEGLVLTHSQFSSYEPELFPGLIYRMVKPKVVLLIFVSGKVVLTGAKVRSEIYEAFDNIHPILKNFKKTWCACNINCDKPNQSIDWKALCETPLFQYNIQYLLSTLLKTDKCVSVCGIKSDSKAYSEMLFLWSDASSN